MATIKVTKKEHLYVDGKDKGKLKFLEMKPRKPELWDAIKTFTQKPHYVSMEEGEKSRPVRNPNPKETEYQVWCGVGWIAFKPDKEQADVLVRE